MSSLDTRTHSGTHSETNSATDSATLSVVEAKARERFKRWRFIRENLHRIIELGQKEGIFIHNTAGEPSTIEEEERQRTRNGDRVNIPTNDLTLMHEAIPFLPIPAALVCMTLNVIFPGSGTIFSGIIGLCLGQPRINGKEGRRLLTLVVNTMIGISQFFTITFFLVGWFWSMTWGGLLIIYSVQYREALLQRRQEAMANAAVKALSKNSVRSKQVKNLISSKSK